MTQKQQLLLIMLLAILLVSCVSSREGFDNFANNKHFDNICLNPKENNNTLYASQPFYYQGHGIDFNNRHPAPVEFTNGTTLDGTKNTTNSMFMYSKNRCHLDCCPSTRSCDKGCICETPEQNDFLSHRGNNNV